MKSMLIIAGTLLLLLGSCKKGEVGPAGPPGTANVLYSDWVPTAQWAASTTSIGAGKKTYYFDLTVSALTADILNKGTVLVFVKFISDPDGNGAVKMLPSIYYNIGGTDTQYRFQYSLFTGKIRIICDIIPNGLPSTQNMVRYILLPGGTGNARVAGIDYASMRYEDICRMHNLVP